MNKIRYVFSIVMLLILLCGCGGNSDPKASLSNVTALENTVTFNLELEGNKDKITSVKINLSDTSGHIDEIELKDDLKIGLNEDLLFKGLKSSEKHYIDVIVIYNNEEKELISDYEFTTKYSLKPYGKLFNLELNENTIIFDAKVNNTPGLFDIRDIEIILKKDNYTVTSLSKYSDGLHVGLNEELVFKYLAPNSKYLIELQADSYVLDTYYFTTGDFVALPGGEINDVEFNDDEVMFDFNIIDHALSIKEISVVLSSNGVEVAELTKDDGLINGYNRDILFYSLKANTKYTIELKVVYDIGEGKVTAILDSYEFITGNFPTGEFSNIMLEGDKITFDVEVNEDGFNIYGLSIIITDGTNYLELSPQDGLVLNDINEGVEFSGLASNTDYELWIVINYNDGRDNHELVFLEIYKFTTSN